MKQLSRNKFLRKLIVPLLKKINFGNIRIKHHWTGDMMKIDTFLHKGYWYHGKSREKETMKIFSQIIQEGDNVIEIGGHIGYISLYFSKLVGKSGKVIVFEPGTNNLQYILNNTKFKDNIKIIEKAVSDYTGKASFFMENLTGQNNSLLENYELANSNIELSCVDDVRKSVIEVDCIKIDDFVKQQSFLKTLNFIKIDIEGAELKALNGMYETLKNNNLVVMVEITANKEEIFNLFTELNYLMFDTNMKRILNADSLLYNTFCLKKENKYIHAFID